MPVILMPHIRITGCLSNAMSSGRCTIVGTSKSMSSLDGATIVMITNLSDLASLFSMMRDNKVEFVKIGETEVRLKPQDDTLKEALSEYTTPSAEEPSAEEVLFWSSK